jgi:UDP-glucose 4-epimerase
MPCAGLETSAGTAGVIAMRVLVTGAAGFLGRAVVARLSADGHEVVAMVRRPDDPLAGAADQVVADLCEPDGLGAALAGVEAVCHLAAVTRARESVADPVRYWRVNAVGTVNLLAALAAGPGRRMVVASTCAVYDLAADPVAITEESAERPMTPYGTSKLAADRAVADAAVAGLVGAVSLRALNISGAAAGRGDRDQARLVPQVVAAARQEGRRLTVNGDGSARRDFVHVEDVADAFALALGACEPGRWRAYNLGSGSAVAVREVIARAGCLVGRELPVDHRPARPEPHSVAADSGRIRSELGWTAGRSTLDRILRDALDAG